MISRVWTVGSVYLSACVFWFLLSGFRFVVFSMGLFVRLSVLFGGVAFLWVSSGMVLD